MRNGLPLWLKLISCPKRNDSMVGYPPTPAPSHRPSRKLSGSRSGCIAAVASGVQVSLWLTGESAWFGLPGRAGDFSLPHAAPLADLLAGVLAAGSVTVCTQCAARRNIE